MAVVKANAYGHGAVAVARAAVAAGAAWLAVATVDEGCQLRAAGLTAPILILAPSSVDEAASAVRAKLTVGVGDLALAAALANAAGEQPATIHIEIDTGLHRFGIHHTVAVEQVQQIAALPGVQIDGIYTHFATADEADRAFHDLQQARFQRLCADLAAAGLTFRHRHQDNSAGSLTGPGPAVTLIRPGVALYGISPSNDVPAPAALRPVLSLHSRVARVFDLQPGDSVSYGRTFIADQPLRAALVPIGYADGLRRSLSNRGSLLLGGQHAPILGRVCMDQTIIAVPPGVNAAVGDEVVIIGQQGTAQITADEVATLAGTIPYEIGTGISSRVPRDYLHGGAVVASEIFGTLYSNDA